MKYSPLLPQIALVFAVAYACTDSTAPANSRPLLTLKNPAHDVGDPPPPPVDVAIAVTISSTPVSAVFTGIFFTNGEIHDDGIGNVPTFDGTAWLRFDNDNKQPGLGGTASSNARFMVKGTNTPKGSGTLYFGVGDDRQAFTIVSVENFTRFAGCGAPEEGFPPSPCAFIDFTAVGEGEVCEPPGGDRSGCHDGKLIASDKSSCILESEGVFFNPACQAPPPPDEEIG